MPKLPWEMGVAVNVYDPSIPRGGKQEDLVSEAHLSSRARTGLNKTCLGNPEYCGVEN